MGLATFRRLREREAAEQVASTPVVKPKRKRKPKASKDGNNDQRDRGVSVGE